MDAKQLIKKIESYERDIDIIASLSNIDSSVRTRVQVYYVRPPSMENEAVKQAVDKFNDASGTIIQPNDATEVGLLNEFAHEFEDYFDAHDRVIADLRDARSVFERAAVYDKETLQAIADMHKASYMDVYKHLVKIQKTDDEFTIPFHEHGRNFQAHLIADVPFKRIREFLTHWYESIEGPLHTVKVTHTHANQDLSYLARKIVPAVYTSQTLN